MAMNLLVSFFILAGFHLSVCLSLCVSSMVYVAYQSKKVGMTKEDYAENVFVPKIQEWAENTGYGQWVKRNRL